MARDKVRPIGATLEVWTALNPVLPRREIALEIPVAIDDSWAMKIGNGIDHYLDLPYVLVGPEGPPGPPGEFTYASDLTGTSTSELTIEIGVHALMAPTGRKWVPGMWITLAATADATQHMVGQCLSYNEVTGAMEVNVSHAVYGSGTYASWVISYAASAGSSIAHAASHTTGGYDEISIATETSAGLMSPADYGKLAKIQLAGAFIGDTPPADMSVGSVWFCTADQVQAPPVIGAIFPHYIFSDTPSTIPVHLSDGYDVNSVVLTVKDTSDSGVIPISAMSVRGVGAVRFVDIMGRSTIGAAIITLDATNAVGLSSTVVFAVNIVAQAYTITASAEAHGSISPTGTVYTPATSSVTFTPVPDSGYAVSVITVDNVPLMVDSYTFNAIDGDHTIVASFDIGYAITASAIGSGSISPSGISTVVANGGKTFFFEGAAGYTPYLVFIDGGPGQDASNGSYTFTNVATNHTIAVNFVPVIYSVSWYGLENGTIEGQPSGSTGVAYGASYSFAVAPATNHETISILVDGETKPPAISYSIPAITGDTVIGAVFRILPPSAVTLSIAPGNTILTCTWGGSSPVPADIYDLYYLAGSADAETIKATGTKVAAVSSGVEITGLANDTVYGVIVVAKNANPTETSSIPVSGSPSTNVLPSSSITATILTYPGSPGALAVTGRDNSATLAWSAATGTVDGYRVYRRLSSAGVFGPFTLINTTANLTYTDTTAINGNYYIYTVSAYNAAGEKFSTLQYLINPPNIIYNSFMGPSGSAPTFHTITNDPLYSGSYMYRTPSGLHWSAQAATAGVRALITLTSTLLFQLEVGRYVEFEVTEMVLNSVDELFDVMIFANGSSQSKNYVLVRFTQTEIDYIQVCNEVGTLATTQTTGAAVAVWKVEFTLAGRVTLYKNGTSFAIVDFSNFTMPSTSISKTVCILRLKQAVTNTGTLKNLKIW